MATFPVSSLVEREIEKKINAATAGMLAGGRQPSDMGHREFQAIANEVRGQFSPAARDKLVHDGLVQLVKNVLGEKIAEVLWQDGSGWDAPPDHVRAIAARLKFADDTDPLECLDVFKDGVMNATRDDVECFRSLGRFRPLFVAQPDDALLGEIATVKASRGDKLAMSVLTWRAA